LRMEVGVISKIYGGRDEKGEKEMGRLTHV
jgi:hypothetical protein